MNDAIYAKAYVEILEILKYLPKNEYEKIPEERIKFFKKNRDVTYYFKFNPNEDIENQKLLKETNAIIVSLFKEYFATDDQKIKIERILLKNEEEHQQELRKKYNPDNIFRNEKTEEKPIINNLPIKVNKQNFMQKIITYIQNIICKFK